MTSNWQKMQQLRSRYAHELQLLQHRQQDEGGCAKLPAVHIRNSLLDSPDIGRVFRRLQRQSERREQETKELLQSRLQRFFASLPTTKPPPSMLPEPLRPPPRRFVAELTNSSLQMASQRPIPPTSGASADATLSVSLSSTNSFDVTTAEISAVEPPPLPPPPPLPSSLPLPQPQQQRSRSTSLTHLTQRRLIHSASHQHLQQPQQQPQQHQHRNQQQPQQHQHRNQQQQQQATSLRVPFLLAQQCSPRPPRESQSMPCTQRHYHPQQQLRETQTAPVPKPRARHPRHPSASGATAAAAVAAAAVSAHSHPVCQVFHVTDVDSVQASLVTREDRRVLKILGQFDCRAEVLDTIVISSKRHASIVYIAGPNGQHLNWCVDRIQDLFPSWELKCQMRSCKAR